MVHLLDANTPQAAARAISGGPLELVVSWGHASGQDHAKADLHVASSLGAGEAVCRDLA